MISRTSLNFILDSLLLLAFIALVAVALVLRVVFPPGPIADGWTVWGANYEFWSAVQFGLILTLAVGFLLHVMLHWNWVCGVVATRIFRRGGKVDDGAQTLYGVGFLVFLLHVIVIVVAAARITVVRPDF